MPTSPRAVPQGVFYQKTLPDDEPTVCSKEGRRRLSEAMADGHAYPFLPLMCQFKTQDQPAYCGLTTLIMTLNTLGIDPWRTWRGVWRWYDENHLGACCINLEEVASEGISIDTFACLARCNGLGVQVRRPSLEEPSECSTTATESTAEPNLDAQFLQGFRDTVKSWTSDGRLLESCGGLDKVVLVVSYDRAAVGQTGSGHFSPIGAYHAASDSVLVLDVARFKYPPHWIKLPRLVKAMYPIDNATGNSRGYIVLGRQRAGSLPPEAGPKLLALASIPTSATMALTTAFQNEIQRQSAEVELSSRQPTLPRETYLEELFRCFLRAVARLDSPIMRGVFFAVAEQRRLVDTINVYWSPQGDNENDDKASIVATLLHAFGDESSHPPVAGRLPPMFGPSRDRADWMDDKAIAAVWVAVFFCLPDELLMVSNGKSGTSSECQAAATELGPDMDTLLPSSELTPLGQVVGADLQLLSRIQSALYLHRKHVDREEEEEEAEDRLKDVHRASRGKPAAIALRSFLEGTICLTTGLAIISMMSLVMGRKRKVVRLAQILRTLPSHARNALAVGVFMALYNGMVARARPGSVADSSPLSSPFFRGFVSTMCALPLAERSGRYFVALFVICRACEVLTVLGYANLSPRLRGLIDRICLGSPATAASLVTLMVGDGILVDAWVRHPESMDLKYRRFVGIQTMVEGDRLEAFLNRVGGPGELPPQVKIRYENTPLCGLHHYRGVDGCVPSILNFSLNSFTRLNVPLYAKLYLATFIIALIKGERNLTKAARRFVLNVGQSSLYMTAQVGLVHLIVCAGSNLISPESLNSKRGPFMSGMLAGPAILLEKPQRRREIAMFVLSHALHIMLQRVTIGPALRRLLLVLAACGVGTLTYAFDAEETRSTGQRKSMLPAAPTPPISGSLRPPPCLPRDLPPSSSACSLYSESELSLEEYHSDCGDSSDVERTSAPSAPAAAAAVESFLDSVFGGGGGGGRKAQPKRGNKAKGKKRKGGANARKAPSAAVSSPSTSSVRLEERVSLPGSPPAQDLIYSTLDGDRLMDFNPEVAVPRIMKWAGVYAGLKDEDAAFTKIRDQYNRQIATKPVPLDAGMAKVPRPRQEDIGPMLSRRATKLRGIDDRKRGGKPADDKEKQRRLSAASDLRELWLSYINKTCVMEGGRLDMRQLRQASWLGAVVEVIDCTDKYMIGLAGTVVMENQNSLVVMDHDDGRYRLLPKSVCTFELRVGSPSSEGGHGHRVTVFGPDDFLVMASPCICRRLPPLVSPRRVMTGARRGFSSSSSSAGPSFTTGVMRWHHKTQDFNKYEYALVTPTDDHVGFKSRRSAPQPRFVFFPSFSLVSSREEWRTVAKHLAELGHTSAIVDWPGFALKDGFANWAMLEDVFQGTLVSTYTHYAYQATVYVLRALRELEEERKQKIAHVVATSPTWLAYLRRWVGEGKPKALARRQQYIENRLPEMLATWFRLSRVYGGKGMVKRIMKRQMDPNSLTPQLIFQKRVILRRHRPYQLDTAMIVGRTDPVKDTVTFMREIMQGTRLQWEG
ncbi:hypothetical protein FOZ63_029424, partial [Perkinsus olseni]